MSSAAYVLLPVREVQVGDLYGSARVEKVHSNEDGWTWVWVANGTILSLSSETPVEVVR